jgi:hypothetical protein
MRSATGGIDEVVAEERHRQFGGVGRQSGVAAGEEESVRDAVVARLRSAGRSATSGAVAITTGGSVKVTGDASSMLTTSANRSSCVDALHFAFVSLLGKPGQK